VNDLAPLEVLFDRADGEAAPLPERLRLLYGPLRLPPPGRRPFLLTNFVETLDGVTALGLADKPGGGPISGGNPHDRMTMGLLRAVADAVVVGAGTARSVPRHLWTPGYIFPALAEEYAELRRRLSLGKDPLNVIVSASGKVEASQAVFSSGVPVLVVTTRAGAARLPPLPSSVSVAVAGEDGAISAAGIIAALTGHAPARRVLLEGGPTLLGDFLAEDRVEDLFLTLAPQIAGRSADYDRPGLVAGKAFAPAKPLWSSLVSVRRGGDFLFLRYSLRRKAASA
jgi:riboflavin biosynthesis pyrimidine reductase